MATPGPSSARTQSLVTSCEACRIRRIKCVREVEQCDESSAAVSGTIPCAACVRKGVRCVVRVRSTTRKRSGKNIERAQQRFGTAEPSEEVVALSQRAVLAASPTSTSSSEGKLLQHQLASTFGNYLFEMFLDREGVRHREPAFAVPAVDCWALKDREHVLYTLSLSDQLLCRLIFASSARKHLPDSPTRQDMARQLLEDARGIADAEAIWRKIEVKHAAALVLLAQIASSVDSKNEESRLLLSTAMEQVRSIARRQPQSIPGENSSGTSGLAWCIAIIDTLSAIDNGVVPFLTDHELSHWLGQTRTRQLVSIAQLQSGIETSGEQVMFHMLEALFTFTVLARKVAVHIASYANNRFDTPESRAEEATALKHWWSEIDTLYAWCSSVSQFNELPQPFQVPHAKEICDVYANLVYSSTILVDLALAEHLGRRVSISSVAADGEWSSKPWLSEAFSLYSAGHRRVQKAVCSYFADSLNETGVQHLVVFVGVSMSVQRFIDLAQELMNAPSDDPELFDIHRRTKVSSLRLLLSQSRRIAHAYPDEMQPLLKALVREQARLANLQQQAPPAMDLGIAQNESTSIAHPLRFVSCGVNSEAPNFFVSNPIAHSLPPNESSSPPSTELLGSSLSTYSGGNQSLLSGSISPLNPDPLASQDWDRSISGFDWSFLEFPESISPQVGGTTQEPLFEFENYTRK